jgi:hypothetical protein
MKNLRNKRAVCLSINLLIALIHVMSPSRAFDEPFHQYYQGYFSDLVLPFGFYFLLCISEAKFELLRPWYAKALVTFGLAAGAEVLQGFGIHALGTTFDPLDFVMYAAGVAGAVALERYCFARVFSFWTGIAH